MFKIWPYGLKFMLGHDGGMLMQVPPTRGFIPIAAFEAIALLNAAAEEMPKIAKLQDFVGKAE